MTTERASWIGSLAQSGEADDAEAFHALGDYVCSQQPVLSL